MKIEQATNQAAAHARWSKEASVRRTKHGPVRTPTMIMCYRGDEPAAMIEIPPHRDEMLRIAHFAARSFVPDVLSISYDTYGVEGRDKSAELDPRTGQKWAENAMHSYVEEFGFDGVVFECMMTTVLNRAGDDRHISQPYRVDGRQVIWTPGRSTHEEGSVTGHVPEVLKAAMNARTIDHKLFTEAPEWVRRMHVEDPVRARWHIDMGAVKVLEEKAQCDLSVCLFAKPGSVQDQLFRQRFPRSRIINPGDLN